MDLSEQVVVWLVSCLLVLFFAMFRSVMASRMGVLGMDWCVRVMVSVQVWLAFRISVSSCVTASSRSSFVLVFVSRLVVFFSVLGNLLSVMIVLWPFEPSSSVRIPRVCVMFLSMATSMTSGLWLVFSG